MKKYLFLFTFVILCLIFIIPHVVQAQNLVPNPSFEQYDTCPNSISQVDFVLGWSSFGNTPDYWNACSSVMNVPNTQAGFQNAFDGNAFCGIYTYSSGTTGTPNYREYIGVQLVSPLIIGQKYYVSFKINKPNNLECATNYFGALFSTVPFTETNLPPINITPQIIEPQIITDTINWTNISGAFIADSTYKYIILGNFYSDSNTDTILYNGQTDCIAYYFIDDVCVSTDSLTCNPPESINEIKIQNNVNIFPIPANDKINIGWNNANNYHADIIIYDVFGKLLIKKENIQSPYNIDISEYSNGIYFMQIRFNNKIFNKKILIEK